ncbi:MAG: glutamate--tRNA ligase [Candidatus Promineifilaceae bacterium]|nr:glutamate--tRNA ligase [Candidatus Promineifilaceae bacterium]
MSVRVRFAPSPTGYLHIGSARTALYNWMFARKHDGQFILRIEDTDQKRSVPGAIEMIMEDLDWLGLDWDEGPDKGGPDTPYIQTERAALYRKWAEWLVEQGHAYRCYCTTEELEARRRAAMAAREGFVGYDRRCRELTPEAAAEKEAAGLECVIRFKAPLEGETVVHDAIRGAITFANDQITDAVLLKSDGLPTYHLANVVDDHFMEITHILRADEWISTAPLHLNLYSAFGWEPPVYAHLPLVLDPSGSGKLSKRTQAFTDEGHEVFVKVEEFRDAGYLPVALRNFLANVGWSFGEDREKFTMEEAIPRFELEDINPAPSRLPYSKLEWLNGQYIQEMEPLELAHAVRPFLEAAGFEADVHTLLPVMPAMKVRMKRLTEAVDFLRFLFKDEETISLTVDDLTHKKLPAAEARAAFTEARDFVRETEQYDLETIQQTIVAIGERHTTNQKAGPFLGRMRLAVTRQQVSPPLFESMVALGRERTLERLETTVNLLAEEVSEAA